jgi:cytochrome c oxidase subunit IV
MASLPHPPSSHGTSTRTYLIVFGLLMVLAATTTLVAFLPLGGLHTLVAVTIAIVKATLVVLFFMHALESGKLVHLIIIAALFCLAIMMAFTLCDFLSRSWDLMLRNPSLI